MGLKKGQCNNISGRPRGSKNKISGNIRKAIEDILREEFTNFPKLMKSLSPKDRMNAILKLLNFVLPRLNTVDQRVDTYAEMVREEEDFFKATIAKMKESTLLEPNYEDDILDYNNDSKLKTKSHG